MSLVNYHVTVALNDPDQLFVQQPDAASLSAEIQAASGLAIADTKCSQLLLDGTSSKSDVPRISGAIKEAYLKANPWLSSDQISVENVEINNKLVAFYSCCAPILFTLFPRKNIRIRKSLFSHNMLVVSVLPWKWFSILVL